MACWNAPPRRRKGARTRVIEAPILRWGSWRKRCLSGAWQWAWQTVWALLFFSLSLGNHLHLLWRLSCQEMSLPYLSAENIAWNNSAVFKLQISSHGASRNKGPLQFKILKSLQVNEKTLCSSSLIRLPSIPVDGYLVQILLDTFFQPPSVSPCNEYLKISWLWFLAFLSRMRYASAEE